MYHEAFPQFGFLPHSAWPILKKSSHEFIKPDREHLAETRVEQFVQKEKNKRKKKKTGGIIWNSGESITDLIFFIKFPQLCRKLAACLNYPHLTLAPLGMEQYTALYLLSVLCVLCLIDYTSLN